jgi:hypothetical protein
MYKLVENDVRLLRRILVAYNTGERDVAEKISRYLRDKGLYFLLPKEQTVAEYEGAKMRLPVNERWLCDHYGAIILPDYDDIIFLNSKWVNPYTLFVRLVEPVPELGELGEKHWIPPAIGGETEFRPAAERMHNRYLKGAVQYVKKLFGG